MLPYGNQVGVTSMIIYTSNLKHTSEEKPVCGIIHYCAGWSFAGKDPFFAHEEVTGVLEQ